METDVRVLVAAEGVPALTILLGWLTYMSGSGVEALFGDSGMKSFGQNLMFVGVILFMFFNALLIYLETQS